MNPESKRKILLVEDDPVAAAITSAMLKHNGYDVVTVAGGTRAIESISNDSSIELILMDIDLGPGMSGPDAAREILKTNDIPIVFLTSHSEREMVYKVRAITRYGYVIKNSGDFVLLSSIEMAFELFESHMKLKKTSEQLAESEQSIRRKLDSILKPEIDLEDVELADLIDKEALQSLIDKFYMLTGFGIGIIDLKGKVLVAAGWQDICVKFHRSHPETLKHCIESDTILSAGVKEGEYKFYKCKNNLWDIVTPIMVEGRHVGNIFLGQFFFEDEMPDKELFIKQAGRYGFNERDYMDALGRVPKWSRDTVNNVMDYYTGLAGLIKNLSYGNIRLARALAERDRVYDDITRKDSILKMITDNMSDLIFIINKDGIYNYVSPSFSRVLGYNPSELEGRFAFEYVHEEDLPAIKSSIDDLYSKGTAKVESRYRDKYGNYSWYETSANVIRNSDGSITGAVVAGRSINDRKEADLKLRESEEIFSKAFNSSPLIMALSDLDTGRYLKVNDNFCRLTGFTKEDSIGKTSIEIGLLKEDDRKKLISHITQSGHIEGVELALYRKNGEMMRTVFSGEVITIAGEKMLLSIVQDVTSHKTALEKLEQSEGRYKLLVENSPLSIFLVRDGRYIYANPAAALRLGYSSPDEITGLEVEKTISPDSMELIRHRIKNAGSGNRNENIELHLRRKDGSLFITESLSLPITLDDGPAILVIGNDVTRERCMQMEL
ncbi:MAG TPA: PAS domain S-box protein, partial [Spirochaetota bacterium]|nr:PAS domain S-box protein [Spirochaetota bacterium]